jgi:hypothetical protein
MLIFSYNLYAYFSSLRAILANEQEISYILYIESANLIDNQKYARALDDELASINIEYSAKLLSGRLGSLQAHQVGTGTFEEFKKSKLNNGMREAQFKSINLQYARDVSFPFHEFKI